MRVKIWKDQLSEGKDRFEKRWIGQVECPTPGDSVNQVVTSGCLAGLLRGLSSLCRRLFQAFKELFSRFCAASRIFWTSIDSSQGFIK
jgi:hypothetical protein